MPHQVEPRSRMGTLAASASAVISISEINHLARAALETHLPSCWIRGEVSNLTRAQSGHWYFSLKDSLASARCVMFKARNQFVDWSLREGDSIEVRAQASLYEPRGDFQLIVDALRKAGQGDLFEAFLKLKDKLQQEGLFDPGKKRPLLAYSKCIGIITSPQAAALRDVLTTLRSRWPIAKVIVYPCMVQGEAAPGQIVQALAQANQHRICDVLLLVRGGGSIEDLWAYNSEDVARALALSGIPVVSGIGHETDFTIADFVADFRAATPTAAAQVVTPLGLEAISAIRIHQGRLRQYFMARLETQWQRSDHLRQRLRHPREHLAQKQERLMYMVRRLQTHNRRELEFARWRVMENQRRWLACGSLLKHRHKSVQRLAENLVTCTNNKLKSLQSLHNQAQAKLQVLNPEKTLARGYSIVRDEAGRLVREADQVTVRQKLQIQLFVGNLAVVVEDKP